MINMQEVLNSSITLNFLRACRDYYECSESKVAEAYPESFMHFVIKNSINTVTKYFRYSFLGRMSSINPQGAKALKKSVVLEKLHQADGLLGARFKTDWQRSLLLKTAKSVSREASYSVTKLIAAVVISAALANAITSVAIYAEITQWGWIIRAMLFLLGCVALFCNISWRGLKEGSVFLQRVYKSDEKD